MKFTINIDQRRAIEMGDIDLIDCVILDWLRNFCTSKNPKIQKNRIGGMSWVSYSEFIKDMPLLRYKEKSTISRRLKALADKSYIVMKTIDQKTYVDTTEKAEYLWADDEDGAVDKPLHERNAPLHERNGTVVSTQPTINTNTKYTKPKKIQTEAVDNSGIHGTLDVRGMPSPTADRIRETIKRGGVKALAT